MDPEAKRPERWRRLAADARLTAEKMQGSEAKQTLLGIAERYELLAQRVEARRKRGASD